MSFDFNDVKNFENFKSIVEDSHLVNDLEIIKKAYEYASSLHAGQTRLSGGEVTWHILTVASYVIQLGLDTTSVISALLHDTVEKCGASIDEIDKLFGTEVAFIVDGLSNIRKFSQNVSESNKDIVNLKNLIFNGTEDIRIIIIRLSEKVHNLLNIGNLDEETKIKSARKALYVYAPLAEYLGLGIFQRVLEDNSFEIINPEEYKFISENIEQFFEKTKEITTLFETKFKEILRKYAIENFEFQIRKKGIYSAYRKIKRRLDINDTKLDRDSFKFVLDIYAGRILLENVEQCYIVLGLIQSNFETLQESFVDYVANPKPNGYKSIHTLIKFEETILEVQIRTFEMHEYNEFGPASHISYKLKGSNTSAGSTYTWTKDLVKWKDNKLTKEDFKVKAFAESIFVFTPKGLVIRLDKGSMPLDFAFRIHTKIGYHYSGAMVNGKMVNMNYKLQTGDTVEILTMKKKNVSIDWVRFAQMPETRNRIRRGIGMTNFLPSI